jgi:hypothetical protein
MPVPLLTNFWHHLNPLGNSQLVSFQVHGNDQRMIGYRSQEHLRVTITRCDVIFGQLPNTSAWAIEHSLMVNY